MSTESRSFGPVTFRQLGYQVTTAAIVGATIYFLDGSLRVAAGAAVVFLSFDVAGELAEAVVGDYADNVLLGILLLVLSGILALDNPRLPLVALGLLGGGWFLIDGIQHLRYGKRRGESSVSDSEERTGLTGFLQDALARLLEPFRLGK